jgi:hypothetical protein
MSLLGVPDVFLSLDMEVLMKILCRLSHDFSFSQAPGVQGLPRLAQSLSFGLTLNP